MQTCMGRALARELKSNLKVQARTLQLKLTFISTGRRINTIHHPVIWLIYCRSWLSSLRDQNSETRMHRQLKWQHHTDRWQILFPATCMHYLYCTVQPCQCQVAYLGWRCSACEYYEGAAAYVTPAALSGLLQVGNGHQSPFRSVPSLWEWQGQRKKGIIKGEIKRMLWTLGIVTHVSIYLPFVFWRHSQTPSASIFAHVSLLVAAVTATQHMQDWRSGWWQTDGSVHWWPTFRTNPASFCRGLDEERCSTDRAESDWSFKVPSLESSDQWSHFAVVLSASAYPTLRLLTWLWIVRKFYMQSQTRCSGLLLLSFLCDSSTPESKHSLIYSGVCGGCPAQWGLCGFPGCALDVVYVLRLLREAWAAVVIPFILWHFLEIKACEQMSGRAF